MATYLLADGHFCNLCRYLYDYDYDYVGREIYLCDSLTSAFSLLCTLNVHFTSIAAMIYFNIIVCVVFCFYLTTKNQFRWR